MTWNPLALATALQTVPEQNIDVTNSESALIIKMNDYGDLQINILFTSRQMIIETFICPVSSISNPDEFNTFLLRNQKMILLLVRKRLKKRVMRQMNFLSFYKFLMEKMYI